MTVLAVAGIPNPFDPRSWVTGLIGVLVEEPAKWIAGQVASAFSSSVTVDLSQGWWLQQYDAVRASSVLLALLLLVLATGVASARGDGRAVARAPAMLLLVAALTSAAPWALAGLNALVMTGAGQLTPTGVAALKTVVAEAFTQHSGVTVPAVVQGMGAGFFGLGAFCVWVELFIHRVLVDVGGLMLPLAFVGLIFEPTEKWARRGIELVVAATFVPLLLAIVVCGGMVALAHGAGGSIATLMVGGAILFLGAIFGVGVLSSGPMGDTYLAHKAAAKGSRTIGGTAAASAGGMAMRSAFAGAAAGSPVPVPPAPAPRQAPTPPKQTSDPVQVPADSKARK